MLKGCISNKTLSISKLIYGHTLIYDRLIRIQESWSTTTREVVSTSLMSSSSGQLTEENKWKDQITYSQNVLLFFIHNKTGTNMPRFRGCNPGLSNS